MVFHDAFRAAIYMSLTEPFKSQYLYTCMSASSYKCLFPVSCSSLSVCFNMWSDFFTKISSAILAIINAHKKVKGITKDSCSTNHGISNVSQNPGTLPGEHIRCIVHNDSNMCFVRLLLSH